MLWYKSWLETRWRFVAGLGLLVCSAAGIVLTYPRTMSLMPAAASIDATGYIGETIREAVELASSYRGYLWSQWFRGSAVQLVTLFAVLLGTGGLASGGTGGSSLFTMSLPVSRSRILHVRAGTGLAELALIAFLPPLTIAVLSPVVGESYGVGEALAHGLCLLIGGWVFVNLALLFSTMFGDFWRPLLSALAVAVVIAMLGWALRRAGIDGIFQVMSGETYFRTGTLPWLGLAASAVASAALLYGASVSFARRDF